MANGHSLPASDTHFSTNFFGLSVGVMALFLLHQYRPAITIINQALILMASTVIPIVLIELLLFQIYKKPSAGLGARNAVSLHRLIVKLIGLAATYGFVFGLYWLFPEYKKTFYQPFWTMVKEVWPFAAAFAVGYFYFVDRWMQEPEDSYYQVGRLLLGKKMDVYLLGRHLRNWLVKAFFFPLMFVYLCGTTKFLTHYDFAKVSSFSSFYDFFYDFVFYIDLIFAVVGYVMTFRLLDTHIRTSEPTVKGWLVAVMCYSPFWSAALYGNYFNYNDGFYWGHWLSNSPDMKVVWGTSILLILLIYSFATASLGIRFSNLTYRGLAACGPFRFCKHPAYVCKNISWWLISIPFISGESFEHALRLCLLLLGVNVIYYLRARTEEAHLSHYPEYVEYALAMNQRSICRWVVWVLPFVKYRRPVTQGS